MLCATRRSDDLYCRLAATRPAVRLAGINVTKYKFIVYVICGGLAAAAGVFITGRTALGTPLNAIQSDFALTTVAACVIGRRHAGRRQGHRPVHGRGRFDPGTHHKHHEPGGSRVLPAICCQRRDHHPGYLPEQARTEEQLTASNNKRKPGRSFSRPGVWASYQWQVTCYKSHFGVAFITRLLNYFLRYNYNENTNCVDISNPRAKQAFIWVNSHRQKKTTISKDVVIFCLQKKES